MIDDKTAEGSPDESNSNAAATKQDVAGLGQDIRALRRDLSADMQAMKNEILHHFDVAIENIEDEMKGANRDEISSLQDAKADYGERISKLEERAGLR